jgi:hypothetical protein
VISPALMTELSHLSEGGAPSLSDGVRALCRRGLMRAHDIAGRLWQDVDTPDAKHHCEWLLRAYGPELRGGIPLDSDSAVTLRLESRAAADACAAALRGGGIQASVLGPHGHGYCVRIGGPSGVADTDLLRAALRAAALTAPETTLRAVVQH